MHIGGNAIGDQGVIALGMRRPEICPCPSTWLMLYPCAIRGREFPLLWQIVFFLKAIVYLSAWKQLRTSIEQSSANKWPIEYLFFIVYVIFPRNLQTSKLKHEWSVAVFNSLLATKKSMLWILSAYHLVPWKTLPSSSLVCAYGHMFVFNKYSICSDGKLFFDIPGASW